MLLEQTMRGVMEENAFLPETSLALTVNKLTEAETREVLSFLSERPVHTICMIGLIRDNGLVSEHNRGTFYGCCNSEGRLEGVGLIGHETVKFFRTQNSLCSS